MTGKYLIPKTQNDSRQPSRSIWAETFSPGPTESTGQAQLELLEERCLLSFGSPTTTTLTLDKFNITYGGSISATPVVSSTHAPGGIPLTGSCQLEVDGNPYGVPQAVGTTFVVTDLPAGWHTLEASYSGDSDYQGSTTSSTSTIYVAAAELTVTANDYSRAYGAADPALIRTASPGLSTATFSSSPRCRTRPPRRSSPPIRARPARWVITRSTSPSRTPRTR